MKRYLLAIMLVLVCIAASLLLGRCTGESVAPPAEPVVIHDTIAVHDTLRLREHTKTIEVIRHDTIWLPKVDSAKNAHTTTDAEYALVPITQSEYRDTFATDSTRAEVAVLFSGYNARIDSVGINYQATIQPVVYEKESGWGPFVGIGASAGYGLGCKDPLRFEPFIGVTVVVGWGYHWKPKKNTHKNKIEKYVLKNDSIPQNNEVGAIKMQK